MKSGNKRAPNDFGALLLKHNIYYDGLMLI